ncbi:peptidase inhibitor family I36 protein [Rugosimonospora africana]|uniref:Peptidase inhibitor family I36 n=1 Tax=Rugosimonospora africana TaxID=556532 RepID=A0A8J3QLH1_9ACTN|nr:peptidase inhibitor family I36 protein [Rugosimonospora africana]GIH12257.1 hypothetical protein Raf01_04290 [Rugosimonospora africana]
MRRLIGTLAALALASVLAVAGLQAPASAQASSTAGVATPAYTECPNGVGCVWDDIGGYGNIFEIAFSKYGGKGCQNLPSNFDNKVKSGLSDYGSGHRLRLWENQGCTGDYVTVDNQFIETFIGSTGWSAFIIL